MANRYTKLSTSTFDPMSFQEQLFLPKYMREQHDSQNVAMSELDSGIAKSDPLGVHSDIASKEQQRLYEQITIQRDKLANEGFTQNAKNELLRLNKEYQSSISPTGVLGKSNAAKQQFEIEKKQYLAQASKDYGPEQAGINWNKHAEKYKEGFDGKTISNIDSYYAPKYKDVIKEAATLFDKAGITSSDITGLSSSNIITNDPNNPGSYILTTKGKRTITGNNRDTLQSALDFINETVNNKDSDEYKSLMHQGKDPKQILEEVSKLSGVFKKNKYAFTPGESIKSSYKPLEPTETNISGGLTASNSINKLFKYSEKSYTDLKSDKYSINEQGIINGYIDKLDNILKNNPTYLDLDNKINAETKVLTDMNSKNYNWDSNAEYAKYLKEVESVHGKGATSIPEIKDGFKVIQKSRIKFLNDKVNELVKPLQEDIQLKSTSFAITPFTPKERSMSNVVNSSLGKVMASTPRALMDNTIISGIQTTSGIQPMYEQDDLEGLSNLVHTAGPDNMELIDFTAEGLNGLASYKIRINTAKDNKYNLKGWDDNQGDIGDGKPITLTLSFKNNNVKGVRDVNGFVQDYIRLADPDKGTKLVKAMNNTTTIDKYRGVKWSDLLKNKGKDFNYSQRVMYEQAILNEIGHGLTNVPKDKAIQLIEKARKALILKTVQ